MRKVTVCVCECLVLDITSDIARLSLDNKYGERRRRERLPRSKEPRTNRVVDNSMSNDGRARFLCAENPVCLFLPGISHRDFSSRGLVPSSVSCNPQKRYHSGSREIFISSPICGRTTENEREREGGDEGYEPSATAGINNFISDGARRYSRQGAPFFSVISIGRMIHAPSRSTSSECLHFVPSRLPRLLPFSCLVSRLSFPCGILHRTSLSLPLSVPPSPQPNLLSFCPTNSILAVERTHFQSSPLLPTSGIASAYRFRCALQERKGAFVLSFSVSPLHSITRVRPATFLSAPGYVSPEPRTRRINLFHLAVRVAAESRELSSPGHREVTWRKGCWTHGRWIRPPSA